MILKSVSCCSATLFFVAIATNSWAQTVYDPAAEFETGWTTHSNPNGVWSYGYSSGFGNPVTLYTQQFQGVYNGPNAQDWVSPSVNIQESPSVEFNNGPAYVGGDGHVDLLANQLVLVAGIGGQYSDLVFTAPTDGMYSIVASFRGDQAGIGTVVGILANGNLLFNSSVTAIRQTVPFSATVSLKAGNMVVFSVGPAGGTQNTGISATITGPASPTMTTEILPQLAFGGGWYSALYFTNVTSNPVSFAVNFIGNDGNPLIVPALNGSSITENLAAQGTVLIEIPNTGALVQGYVSAALPAGVTGYGVFRQSVPGSNDQEAVVPLSGTTATTSILLFDDTKYVTGVAVVNLASVSTTISVLARDNHGNTIGSSNIPLVALAKTAVVLRNLPGLAGIAGALGSVSFTAPIGNLAVLGLRFNGAAFTSIPTSGR